MNNSGAEPYITFSSTGTDGKQPAAILDLLSTAAGLLLANGQTTQRTVAAVKKNAGKLGYQAEVFPYWGELTIQIKDANGTYYETTAVQPAGVDMNKVIATLQTMDQICANRMNAAAARVALADISQLPPVAVTRFALMAGIGAAALAIIFGADRLPGLILIAFSAGTGACLRRWLAGKTHNLFVQPFGAALLAGILGAIAIRLQLSSALQLVAICPCMILVPGAHLLNGALDFAHARITLGAARFTYAGLVILAICAGLLPGLAAGGVILSVSPPGQPVPFVYDITAAGFAVAAFGTFFSMPWRMLPIPVLIGMLAHGCRWVAISLAGAGMETGAFIACLVVGTIMTPVSNHLRLPFAGLAFASVVSLIPGAFLFRMASGLVSLATTGPQNHGELLMQLFSDGITAVLIILAMAAGLIFPKLCIEHFNAATKDCSSSPP